MASAPNAALPRTLKELRASGAVRKTVKQEIRSNLTEALRTGQEIFASIHGFDDSVLPALERGLLAGHDIILLGERGQAKTRIIRALTSLLDEHTPVIEACEINDHPYDPMCARCKALVVEKGDDTPVMWVHRETRFAEKLATPDSSVADLVGDVDPIRVAEGRYLSDEMTIHYGLIPRTNRGIFAVNELPDLPERIQVALLNILEERDVQIRGFKIRLPLDLMLVASANPEDYTHRGRIISPLKDRFGTQVRTHYPEDPKVEIAIMEQEAAHIETGVPINVPLFLKEVLAEFTDELRRSPQVNQHSGVSVRFSIGNLETITASALRRAIRAAEPQVVPRTVDLWTVIEASVGRVEFDTMEDGREEAILSHHLKRAIAEVFRSRLGGEDLSGLVMKFEEGFVAETSDALGAENFLAQFGQVPGLDTIMQKLDIGEESPWLAASALEFALEGLHLMKRINKKASGQGRFRFARR